MYSYTKYPLSICTPNAWVNRIFEKYNMIMQASTISCTAYNRTLCVRNSSVSPLFSFSLSIFPCSIQFGYFFYIFVAWKGWYSVVCIQSYWIHWNSFVSRQQTFFFILMVKKSGYLLILFFLNWQIDEKTGFCFSLEYQQKTLIQFNTESKRKMENLLAFDSLWSTYLWKPSCIFQMLKNAYW